MPLRVIGDIHAQFDFALKPNRVPYVEIIAGCDHSVQIGDMGDAETYRDLIENVDPRAHRFFGGNHDHYSDLPPHAIGDFGDSSLGGVDFFFVRGARSSDKRKLLERGAKLGKTLWFEEEQLPLTMHSAILDAYSASKPRVVFTHTCPPQIGLFMQDYIRTQSRFPVERQRDDSRTGVLLEQMLDCHQPELWCFGHYHHDWIYQEGATEFRCVGELSYFDIATGA